MSFADSNGNCIVPQCIGKGYVYEDTYIVLVFIVSSHCRAAFLLLKVDIENQAYIFCSNSFSVTLTYSVTVSVLQFTLFIVYTR